MIGLIVPIKYKSKLKDDIFLIYRDLTEATQNHMMKFIFMSCEKC